MRTYIDTSVLTGVYCREAGSGRAQRAIQGCEPVISALVRLEFSATVAKKLRTKTVSATDATRIISQFHDHLRAGIFEMSPIRELHYALANEWVDSFTTSLRTLDALHLAVAASAQMPLITADSILAKSAQLLGIEVIKP